MDEAGLGYLLMLRTSFGLHAKLCDRFAGEIHAFDKMLSSPDDEKYGITDEDILAAADELNGRPRKKLGYCTPEELFEDFLDAVYAA